MLPQSAERLVACTFFLLPPVNKLRLRPRVIWGGTEGALSGQTVQDTIEEVISRHVPLSPGGVVRTLLIEPSL
jgi:hypothetical protein